MLVDIIAKEANEYLLFSRRHSTKNIDVFWCRMLENGDRFVSNVQKLVHYQFNSSGFIEILHINYERKYFLARCLAHSEKKGVMDNSLHMASM
jgi:hypothetical protein